MFVMLLKPGLEDANRLTGESRSALPRPSLELFWRRHSRQRLESLLAGQTANGDVDILIDWRESAQEFAGGLGMGEAALSIKRDTASTATVLHDAALRDETVQAHMATEITGVFGAKHGIDAVVYHRVDGIPPAAIRKWLLRRVIGEFQRLLEGEQFMIGDSIVIVIEFAMVRSHIIVAGIRPV